MKALIVGGSGYTGGELIRLLSKHPQVDSIQTTSRQHVGKPVSSIHPDLESSLSFTEYSLDDANNSDVVFLCVPHTKAMDLVSNINTKIIDLSADFRITDIEVYEHYYGVKHSCPELLEESVYGLPELHRQDIKKKRIIANPGCYATNIILGLYPLVKNFDFSNLTVSALTGNSGSGRGNVEGDNPPDVLENVIPYKTVHHRHTAELVQELGADVSFVPHLLQIWRGILSTIQVKLPYGKEEIIEVFKKQYSEEPFVDVVDEPPLVKQLARTNKCVIGGFEKLDDRLIYFCAIDNLMKGASGQAVQNMNIMFGYDETDGLIN